ncbi:heterogeneous nuclear ribonucleoprotein A1-like isoform X2 [Gordionus sp. m RMFG-2023]|uniref:heterogeneous nuclear ribonucleoprotein A1-like isoform X2 n=1 Tax=Gordionus sp. m RMFG-2023 TaxID=3053472 RepID=UPI0031FE23A8
MGKEVAGRIFIGNLERNVDEEKLTDVFSIYGKVVDVEILRSRETKESRGFGFLTFETNLAAETAIKKHTGKMLNGRAIRLATAIKRRDDDDDKNSPGNKRGNRKSSNRRSNERRRSRSRDNYRRGGYDDSPPRNRRNRRDDRDDFADNNRMPTGLRDINDFLSKSNIPSLLGQNSNNPATLLAAMLSNKANPGNLNAGNPMQMLQNLLASNNLLNLNSGALLSNTAGVNSLLGGGGMAANSNPNAMLSNIVSMLSMGTGANNPANLGMMNKANTGNNFASFTGLSSNQGMSGLTGNQGMNMGAGGGMLGPAPSNTMMGGGGMMGGYDMNGGSSMMNKSNGGNNFASYAALNGNQGMNMGSGGGMLGSAPNNMMGGGGMMMGNDNFNDLEYDSFSYRRDAATKRGYL